MNPQNWLKPGLKWWLTRHWPHVGRLYISQDREASKESLRVPSPDTHTQKKTGIERDKWLNMRGRWASIPSFSHPLLLAALNQALVGSMTHVECSLDLSCTVGKPDRRARHMGK